VLLNAVYMHPVIIIIIIICTVMHGKYIRNIDRQLISEEDTFIWLSKGYLKSKLKVK